MAPNNALRQSKPQPQRVTGTATAAATGATTMLPPGTVESRGMGINNSNNSNSKSTTDTASTTTATAEDSNNNNDDATTTRARVQRDIQAFQRGNANASVLSLLKSELRCFFTVWTFVTRFPAPTWVDHHPGYLMRGMVYFPVAGTAIGAWMALWYQLAAVALGLAPTVAACGATIAGAYLTGCFHEDGLGDASDGFGGGWSRTQILTIMTDTRLGTYGCVALILYLGTKIHLVASMADATTATLASSSSSSSSFPLRMPWQLPPVMASMVVAQTVARLAPTLMIHSFPYVDESTGPKTHYYSFMVAARQLVTRTRVMVAYVYSGAIVAMLWYPHYYSYYYDSVYNTTTNDTTTDTHSLAAQAAAVAVALVAALLLIIVSIVSHCAGSYATYMIGGVMGDYLGAMVCGTELVVHTLLSILAPTTRPTPLASLLHWMVHALVVGGNDVSSSSPNSNNNNQDTGGGGAFAIYATSVKDWCDSYPTEWYTLSHPLGITVVFAAVLTFTIVWCRTVGHPNVFVRDTVIQAMEQTNKDNDDDDNDTVQIGLPVVVAERGGSASTTTTNDENTVANTTTASSTTTTCPSRTAAERILQSATSSFQDRYNAALTYLDALAKPMGSLGTLEDWAARLAALQRTTRVTVGHVCVLIFAADHGVAASSEEGGESASAYPQVVTQGIVKGLKRDIAGASVLARSNGVTLLRVVDVGVVSCEDAAIDIAPNAEQQQQQQQGFTEVVVSDRKLRQGTRNFCRECAMTSDETERCVQVGRDELAQLVSDCDGVVEVVVLGEVGIGNTTSSSALIAYLASASVESVCGGGATVTRLVTPEAVDKKQTIVAKALDRHRDAMTSAMDALSCIGGAEIAAIVGAILEASELGLAVLIDGFVLTAAALVAASISPISCRIMLFATKSAEPGQLVAIEAIQAIALANNVVVPSRPALDMGLRMGEATGALLAIPILRSAACVINDMGTIAAIMS